MFYSPRFFTKSYTKEKRREEKICCLVLYRPLSFLFSSLFASIGIGANGVTFLSLLVGLASCGTIIADIFLQTNYLLLVSFGLFNLWAILDCVDGNIARSIKKEKYGDFLDAIAGYVYQGLFIGLLGFRCAQMQDIVLKDFNQYIALFSSLGALCSTSIILFNKKFSENSEEYGPKIKNKEKNKYVKIASRIWGEIGFGGAMPILVFVFYFLDLLSLFILIYSILSVLLFVLGTAFLCFKVFKANKIES